MAPNAAMPSHASSSSVRPPLPPRQQSSVSALSPSSERPPVYESMPPKDDLWSAHDPRSSSEQSLVPTESNQQNERRRLLLVYIHGFMGDETSFRSFPAHVHNLLTILLSETHVVHTKIYPRYRSKKKITVARDAFSEWLEPHEGPKTDVVLLGHSMGGLLCAEVALVQPDALGSWPLKHRILGTVNFDVPFLGMHPHVVKSGLASIFKSSEEVEDQYQADDAASFHSGATTTTNTSKRTDTLWTPERPDPNYNPTFNNDVVLPMRKGWKNAWHFLNKHSDHLYSSTKQLVTSHLEFGGAMANYGELKARYGRIRALEQDDEGVRKSVIKTPKPPPRVRFVNYYTASTGRITKRKSPSRPVSPSTNKSTNSLSPSVAEDISRGRTMQESSMIGPESSRSQSPRISLEEHSDEGIIQKQPAIPDSDEEDWQEAAESLTIGDAPNMLGKNSSYGSAVPDLPAPPPPLDVSYIRDPATRKLVEQEHERAVKAYEQAINHGKAAIDDARRAQQERQMQDQNDTIKTASTTQTATKPPMTQKEQEEQRLLKEKQRMEAEGRRLRGEPDPVATSPTPPASLNIMQSNMTPVTSRASNISSSPSSASRSRSPAPDKSRKPKKDLKFCTLPPKDSHGERDPTWVRVFMENVDEVGAHCGLFFVDERYERLVGDVAERIEIWVREDMDRLFANASHED